METYTQKVSVCSERLNLHTTIFLFYLFMRKGHSYINYWCAIRILVIAKEWCYKILFILKPMYFFITIIKWLSENPHTCTWYSFSHDLAAFHGSGMYYLAVSLQIVSLLYHRQQRVFTGVKSRPYKFLSYTHSKLQNGDSSWVPKREKQLLLGGDIKPGVGDWDQKNSTCLSFGALQNLPVINMLNQRIEF